MDWSGLLFGPDGWGGLLLKGAGVTILLAISTLPLGFGGGLALALLKFAPYRTVRTGSEACITFFRGTPDLLVLFIVYFGLQALVDRVEKALAVDAHIELNAFAAGVVALSAVAAAYSSEVWFSALAAVPSSQLDAARALGLNKRQILFAVLLPQICPIALPGLGNIWNSLLKDTSIVSTIAVVDLLRAASEASRSTARPILFYGAAAAVYVVFGVASAMVQRRIEVRFDKKAAT